MTLTAHTVVDGFDPLIYRYAHLYMYAAIILKNNIHHNVQTSVNEFCEPA